MLEHLRSPLTLIVTACLAASLSAQTFDPSAKLSDPLGSTGPITRTVASDLDNDRATEVIFIEDDTLKVHYGAFVFDTTIDTGLAVSDIAVASGRATSGADAVLVTGSTGLHLLEYTPSASEHFTSTPLDTTVWSGARRVVTMNGASSAPTVAGITENGKSVAVLTDAFSGAPNASTINVPGDVLDVAVVNWSDDLFGEIAVATTEGFYVYDTSGVLLHAVPAAFDRVMLAVIKSPGPTLDRVAAIVHGDASGLDHLYVLGQALVTEHLVLGDVESYAMVAGDVDDDGHSDLVVAHRFLPFATGPFVLFNTADSGPTYSWTQAESLDLGVGDAIGPDELATPVIADVRADGDMDILVHSHAADALALVEGATVNHADHELKVMSASAVGWTDAMQVDMRVDFQVPTTTIANPTHLLVDQWAASWKNGTPLLHSNGIAKQATPLGEGASFNDLSIILHDYDFGGHFTLRVLVLRVGELSPTGQLLDVGPPTTFLAAMDDDDTTPMTSDAVLFLGLLDPLSSLFIGGSVLGGGLDPLPTPPPFDPMDDPPASGDLNLDGEIAFE